MIAACGDDEGTDTISVDRFPAAYAQALCGSLQHCCDENLVVENFSSCTGGWKTYVETLLGTPAARTNYEPRTAKACVDRIRTAGGISCQPIEGSISNARDTCLNIFIGKTPLGSPCTTAAECAPSPNGGRVACEVPPEKNDAGVLPLHIGPLALTAPVCVAAATAPATAACLVNASNVQSNCDQGLYCEPKSAKCLPLGKVGEECIVGSCAAGGVCATAGANQGKCVPTSALGGPCATSADCDATSRCDTAAQKCAARKNAGESCSEDVECNVGTCDTGTKRCLKNTIATTNTCNGRAS